MHEGGFEVVTDGTDVRFLSRRGEAIGSAGIPPELKASLPTVRPSELVWDGDPVDYDAVIDCLVPPES